MKKASTSNNNNSVNSRVHVVLIPGFAGFDLLKSGSGLHLNKFAEVWDSVFDFCVS
jgi:hypothetical protein